jgi:hypothetical protein
VRIGDASPQHWAEAMKILRQCRSDGVERVDVVFERNTKTQIFWTEILPKLDR